MSQVKIGIIREMKTPPDSRVVLTPAQCAQLIAQYPQLDIAVQSSPNRCYTDAEYQAAGVTLREDMTDRDILIGVKEVPISAILPNKTYLCFSHTHKMQQYNRPLLQAFIEVKEGRMIMMKSIIEVIFVNFSNFETFPFSKA